MALFDGEAIADRVGFRAMLASSAIPGLFPPVDIDGDPHVDGGLLMNTPLKPAVRLGADVLHVIYLDPAVARIPLPSTLPSTVDTLYRATAILMADHINADIAIAARINQLIRPAPAGRARRWSTGRSPSTATGRSERSRRRRRPARLPARLRRPLDRGGHRVAVEHDCARDGLHPARRSRAAMPRSRIATPGPLGRLPEVLL